jgi:hypothetical protein
MQAAAGETVKPGYVGLRKIRGISVRVWCGRSIPALRQRGFCREKEISGGTGRLPRRLSLNVWFTNPARDGGSRDGLPATTTSDRRSTAADARAPAVFDTSHIDATLSSTQGNNLLRR